MITGMPRIAIAVRDFQASLVTFRDKLGMPVIDLSATSVDSLGANLAMCVPAGGSNIELMSPAGPADQHGPLSRSLQRFLDRHGEGLFALMLEAPDPDAEAEILSDRGLDVLPLMAGSSGRDIHPSSTHGVLIRVYPDGSFQRPSGAGDSKDSALSGISRVIIAVHDLDHAISVYGEKLGMAIDQPCLDSDRGVRAAICNPASGGAIELVSVANRERPFAGAIFDFLTHHREGMFALVLQSSQPIGLAPSLTESGLTVRVSADSPEVLEIQASSTFGALLRIEPA